MFGWISKRRHMREITQARETYRWEAEQKMVEAERLRSEYRARIDHLVHAQTVEDFNEWGRRKRILIEIDPYLMRQGTMTDWEWIARKIISDLQHVARDHRPDFRQVMPQGIGGPELPSRMPL